VLPDTIPLTAENFQKLINDALCTNFARSKLTELLAAQERQAAAEGRGTDEPSVAPAPTSAPHHQPPKPAPNTHGAPGDQHPHGGASHNANPPEAKRIAG
jgi:hypothetical protein